MKKTKFSDTQIIAIFNQPESGTPIPELFRENGMIQRPSINGDPNTAVWMPL